MQQADLSKGIPAGEDQFAIVYHSHILEHFEKRAAERFIAECYRVLKPGGILRLATPDLEQIARQYLIVLEKAWNDPDSKNAADHNWAVIEMYDQAVRSKPGGSMAEYWQQANIANESTLIQRVGQEYLHFKQSKTKPSLSDKLRLFFKKPIYSLNLFFDQCLNRFFPYSSIQIGRFRKGGEIHQWMYDKFSLRQILSNAGFTDVKIQEADTSYISDWNKWSWLDIEDGKARKPDSIFIEAKKPA